MLKKCLDNLRSTFPGLPANVSHWERFHRNCSDEDEETGDGGEISELPLTSGDVQQTGRPEENGNDDSDNDVASNADGREVSKLPCTSGDVRENVCTVANKLHIVHRDTGIDVPVLTENIVYHRAAKVRGRPKGTGKSLNRKRKCENASNNDASGNCAECGHVNPPVLTPGRKRFKKSVQRVQCDTCDFWYHLSCTKLQTVPGNGERFVCIRCS